MPLFDSLNASSTAAQTHRLGKSPNVPTTEELKYAFEECKKRKKIVELPFEHPHNRQNFIVRVELGKNTAPPNWSFIRIDNGRPTVLWTRATTEIMMIQSKVKVESSYVQQQQVQQTYDYQQFEDEPLPEEFPMELEEPAPVPIVPPPSTANPFGMLASPPAMFQQPAGSQGALPGMEQPPPSPPSPFGLLPTAPPSQYAAPSTFVPQAQAAPPNPVPEPALTPPAPEAPAGQWDLPPEQSSLAHHEAAPAASPFAPPLPDPAAAPPMPAPVPAQPPAPPMPAAVPQPAAAPQPAAVPPPVAASQPQVAPPQAPPPQPAAAAPQKSVAWGSPSAPPPPPVPAGGEVTVPEAVPLDWTAAEESRNALTDPKTGYLSTSAMMFFLMRSWNEHKRDASPFALVIFEILIQYPDGQVIPLPAEALVPLSSRLLSACGSLDIMTYMNGDFVVLLPSCDRAGMAEFCQRLYVILTETALLPDASGKDLAFISIGGASTETSPDPGVVVAAARQAKEMAKQGRSTCTMFP